MIVFKALAMDGIFPEIRTLRLLTIGFSDDGETLNVGLRVVAVRLQRSTAKPAGLTNKEL
jgi:hypothetical protein